MQGRSILLGQVYEHRVPSFILPRGFSRSFAGHRGLTHIVQESLDENGRDSLSTVLGATWLHRACPAGYIEHVPRLEIAEFSLLHNACQNGFYN